MRFHALVCLAAISACAPSAVDPGSEDAGDVGRTDAGPSDGGAPDAGPHDGGQLDGGQPDAGDGATDAGVPDPCAGKQCGGDGDGGSCGGCNPGSFCSATQQCVLGKLDWAGYRWTVRTGVGGPGPNTWDRRNVSLDDAGHLHLRIENRGGTWTTAELTTEVRLGFGEYRFYLDARPDLFDRNVVLGLFTYPTSDVGPDTTNEIDIEFARWGQPAFDPLNYTVWPVLDSAQPTSTQFPLNLSGSFTTHRFVWAADRIDFDSHHGFRLDAPSTIASWTFAPADAGALVPQAPVPLHFNLWLFQGRAPFDDAGVEIVLRDFEYLPP